jgi:thymidylate synthase
MLQEQQYINLLKDIIENGVIREDRTGIGTKGVFGRQLRFDCSNNVIPILTCRKIKYQNAIEEFLFMWKGKTQTKELEEKGVNIWKGNTTKEFQNKVGLYHLKEGDMGKMYGFQLRQFGNDEMINDESQDYGYRYERNFIDQLEYFINEIKTNPNSRRIIMTTYNPLEKDDGVLFPCHGLLIQAFIEGENISLSMTQRSADTIIGIPFNISFYSLMLHTIASITGYKAKDLVLNLNDCHIYLNHIDKVKEKLFNRELYKFPTLKFVKEPKSIKDVDEMESDNIVIENYISNGALLFDMAI